MRPRSFLRCPGDPKPDAEIDVVFGFAVQSGLPLSAKFSDGLHIENYI